MIDVITPTVSLQVAPTVTAAAYASGNVIGGLLTLAGAVRSNANGGLVQSATAAFASGVTPALDLVLFNASPSSSTITDKTALAVNAADLAKVIGVIHLADSTSLGTPSVMQSQQQAIPFSLGNSTTLFGALVARAAPTLGSTSDLTVTVQVLQN